MGKIVKSLMTVLVVCMLAGCATEEAVPSVSPQVSKTPEETVETTEGEEKMKIQVKGNGAVIEFAINDSQAAKDLYAQLPVSVEVENFSNNEKIFYPQNELDVSDAPVAEGGAGTLAYYAPWGDVVMFYGSFSSNGSLYELGEAVNGAEMISTLSGTVEVSIVE